MPYAKNTRAKAKKDSGERGSAVLENAPVLSKAVRILDFGEEDESLPEEKPEGAIAEEADGDETALPEEEELDAADLNPFGDKWEE